MTVRALARALKISTLETLNISEILALFEQKKKENKL